MARRSFSRIKERVRCIFKWLDGSVARQSFSRIKERVRCIFKWLDGSVARQSFSRIKERVRCIFKWLGGSSVAFTAEPPSQLNNISLGTIDELPSQLNLYSFKSGPVFCSLAPLEGEKGNKKQNDTDIQVI